MEGSSQTEIITRLLFFHKITVYRKNGKCVVHAAFIELVKVQKIYMNLEMAYFTKYYV